MAHDMANILHRDISAGNIMITEEGRGLLVDWDLSKSLGNADEAPSPPERTGTWQFMAARLIVSRLPETPLPIPNREDDLESFWHVLFWIVLKHCDHRANSRSVGQLLGSLFDSKYVGETGQAEGGGYKRAALTSPSTVRGIGLVSTVLDTLLVDTASVLATRYPSSLKIEDGISQVQRIWEQLELKDLTLDEELLLAELYQRKESRSLVTTGSYDFWRNWRTIQDNPEWMEKIFENVLQDPSTDWNTGNANVPRILPQPSAPKGPKRRNDSDIDGRKPKKVSNLESFPE
jgi:serine/threonine protein kinase